MQTNGMGYDYSKYKSGKPISFEGDVSEDMGEAPGSYFAEEMTQYDLTLQEVDINFNFVLRLLKD